MLEQQELALRQAIADRHGLSRPVSPGYLKLWRNHEAIKRGKKRSRDRRRAAEMNAPAIERFDRGEIIERDRGICHLCGRTCDPGEIHIDHVIPLARGGAHTRENVRVACSSCNVRKGATLLSDPP